VNHTSLDRLTYTDIWNGALLVTIGHAVYHASLDSDAWYVDWDGIVYLVNNGGGTRGGIVFDRGQLVGSLCDVHSPRTPWRSTDKHDPYALFSGIPDMLRPLADRALSYDIYEYGNSEGPVATAVFWTDGEQVTSSEPWEEVVEHGAHAIQIETTKNKRDALTLLQEDLDLSSSQIALVYALYQRRVNRKHGSIIITSQERRVLTADGEAGLDHSRRLLAAVAIHLA
jgi:hypothetical protein